MAERRPGLVLFDLDGTLADTAPDLGAAANRLRVEDGLPRIDDEVLRPYTSQGARGLLFAAYGMTADDSRFDHYRTRFLSHYAAALCHKTRLFDGMAALLDMLEAQGVHWGVVTNKHERFTLPLMEALQLKQRAACIISGDTAPRPKPAPDPLLLACQQVGVQPLDAWYVGDDLRDIIAGKAAGMGTIAACYGYLGDGGNPDDWGADHQVAHPLQIAAIFGLTC
ncbi:phosphoglycolate phosphatase [Oryzomicrobium terrae]|uniref:Phosphoglycolate phosphatase n=1 Tax=Oryzomicrobium terrae TaxID=1735038 RepID=A0A5C1E9U7_9RHOO|nr:HAD-IA family hydrolase [Oryzomicrobium terrae]QEL65670.1 phosphoglycolate phosphatase [Oryzomicrobium terrae]